MSNDTQVQCGELEVLEQGLLYHEQGLYKESLECFLRAAAVTERQLEALPQPPKLSGHPLAIYMAAVTLREGWASVGTDKEQRDAFNRLLPARRADVEKSVVLFSCCVSSLLSQYVTRHVPLSAQTTLQRLKTSVNLFRSSTEAPPAAVFSKTEKEMILQGVVSGSIPQHVAANTPASPSKNGFSTVSGVSASLNSDGASMASNANPLMLMSKDEVSQYIRSVLPLPVLELGFACLYGWGCQKDVKRALSFLEVAASLGDFDAQEAIGNIYETGSFGVRKNSRLAAKYYRMISRTRADMKLSEIPGRSWIWKSKYNEIHRHQVGQEDAGPFGDNDQVLQAAQTQLKDLLSVPFKRPSKMRCFIL
ncbi:hypothetical protein HDU91_005150 [Kappamyces sp. JEL0680]|nr:hypothetical protein HDU91_005150 [Kappamyces sp. JEL0680]